MFAGIESLSRSRLRLRMLRIAGVSFAAGLSQAALLIVVSELAVNGVQGHQRLHIKGFSLSTTTSLLICGGLLVVFSASSVSAAFMSSALGASTAEGVRANVIGSFFTADWSIQSGERLGHVQQLLTVNCDNIANIALQMSQGIQALLSVTALLLGAFVVSPATAGVVLAGGLLISLCLRPFLSLGRRASIRLNQDSRAMATQVTEYTTLAREIRTLGVQDIALDELGRASHSAAVSFRKNRRLMMTSPVAYQTAALTFIVVGLSILVGHTGKNVGEIGAVVLLTLRSLTYGSGLQSNSQQLRAAEGFLDAVEADVSRYATHEAVFDQRLPASYDLSVDGVSFAYQPGTLALSNLSFWVPHGSIIGVVGRSGSGKTTLSQLVLGMRQPSKGEVLVGDVPAAAVHRGNGISPIASVAQESILLQGSISSNIAFFRDVPAGDIETASRAAHLHEDVAAMPAGYETLVGEGGNALSGGQRQRVAIARALVGHPKLLVLDEPTSALDARSEELIRRTLSELRGSVTVFVISHRLATVEDCDLLLVLNDGAQADFGPRAEVMSRRPYQQVRQGASGYLGPDHPDAPQSSE